MVNDLSIAKTIIEGLGNVASAICFLFSGFSFGKVELNCQRLKTEWDTLDRRDLFCVSFVQGYCYIAAVYYFVIATITMYYTYKDEYLAVTSFISFLFVIVTLAHIDTKKWWIFFTICGILLITKLSMNFIFLVNGTIHDGLYSNGLYSYLCISLAFELFLLLLWSLFPFMSIRVNVNVNDTNDNYNDNDTNTNVEALNMTSRKSGIINPYLNLENVKNGNVQVDNDMVDGGGDDKKDKKDNKATYRSFPFTIWCYEFSDLVSHIAVCLVYAEKVERFNEAMIAYCVLCGVNLFGWVIPSFLIVRFKSGKWIGHHIFIMDILTDVPMIAVVFIYRTYAANIYIIFDIFVKVALLARGLWAYKMECGTNYQVENVKIDWKVSKREAKEKSGLLMTDREQNKSILQKIFDCGKGEQDGDKKDRNCTRIQCILGIFVVGLLVVLILASICYHEYFYSHGTSMAIKEFIVCFFYSFFFFFVSVCKDIQNIKKSKDNKKTALSKKNQKQNKTKKTLVNIYIGGYCDDYSGGLSWVWVFIICMIIMILICSLGIIYIMSGDEQDEQTVGAVACIIALFFGIFLIYFGSKCVELNGNFGTNAYCGPAGDGGGITMIVIGSLIVLVCILALFFNYK